MHQLPEYKCSLHIDHNDHKSCYETVEQAAEDLADYWVSDEERQKAIVTGSIWTVQWYPETPVGFHRVAASTLEAALKGARDDS